MKCNEKLPRIFLLGEVILTPIVRYHRINCTFMEGNPYTLNVSIDTQTINMVHYNYWTNQLIDSHTSQPKHIYYIAKRRFQRP